MKILVLNWKDVHHPRVGGAELIAHYFSRNLVKEGHDVTIFSMSFDGASKTEIIDKVKVVRGGNAYTVFLHAFAYYKNLQKKPDVVLEMLNTVGWYSKFYAFKSKKVAYLNQLAREVWSYEFPWPFSWIGFVFERIQYLFYKNVPFLCYSNSTKQDLIQYGVPAENIYQFNLGLDHDRYYPKGKKSKTPLFVFVARLVRMKRADLCIKAMQHVVKKHPKAKLVVVGNGPEENNLRKLVSELELDKNVSLVCKGNFFIDKKNEDPKVKLMREAWVHLLPSVKEGWGMVVTETAACGTPSIVSDVTGLRDSVSPGKSGTILSANPSPEELGAEMIKFIEDDAMREKFSKGAITWGKQFTWEKSYTGFRKQLMKIIKK